MIKRETCQEIFHSPKAQLQGTFMNEELALHRGRTAVSDPTRCHGRPLTEMAAAAVRGGATLLQLPNKDSTTATSLKGAQTSLLRPHLLNRIVLVTCSGVYPPGLPLWVNSTRPGDVRSTSASCVRAALRSASANGREVPGADSHRKWRFLDRLKS